MPPSFGKRIGFFSAALLLAAIGLLFWILLHDQDHEEGSPSITPIPSSREDFEDPSFPDEKVPMVPMEPSGEPQAEHVCWQGRIFDFHGRTMKGVSIQVIPCKDKKYEDHLGRSVESIRNEEERIPKEGRRKLRSQSSVSGSFSFHSLSPGSYRVILWLPREVSFKDRIAEISMGNLRNRRIDWGTMTFDAPGTVKKDIHLKINWGSIQGRVLDKVTGMPTQASFPKVSLSPLRFELGSGSWKITLEGKRLGSVNRTVEIMGGVTTDLLIFRTDLEVP